MTSIPTFYQFSPLLSFTVRFSNFQPFVAVSGCKQLTVMRDPNGAQRTGTGDGDGGQEGICSYN